MPQNISVLVMLRTALKRVKKLRIQQIILQRLPIFCPQETGTSQLPRHASLRHRCAWCAWNILRHSETIQHILKHSHNFWHFWPHTHRNRHKETSLTVISADIVDVWRQLRSRSWRFRARWLWLLRLTSHHRLRGKAGSHAMVVSDGHKLHKPSKVMVK